MSKNPYSAWRKSFDSLLGGGTYKRRSRHIRSQMKFWSSSKGKSKMENQSWSFARKGRDWNALN